MAAPGRAGACRRNLQSDEEHKKHSMAGAISKSGIGRGNHKKGLSRMVGGLWGKVQKGRPGNSGRAVFFREELPRWHLSLIYFGMFEMAVHCIYPRFEEFKWRKNGYELHSRKNYWTLIGR
jgi:hypothetical protein